jgi:hypothetical protein
MTTFRRAAALALLAAAVAGCAPAGRPATPAAAPPPPAAAAEFAARARVVADAWNSSGQSIWTTGLRTDADLTIFQLTGFPDGATKAAATEGRFQLSHDLPAQRPPAGSVRFPDGSTMDVPVISAREAYEALTANRVDCVSDYNCGTLTIVAAALTTVTLNTSRGAATVPAWSFTVRELPGDARVVQVAVDPAKILPPPTAAVSKYRPVQRISAALAVAKKDGSAISLTVGGDCVSHQLPLVWESGDVVIVGVYDPPADIACAGPAHPLDLTATLSRPLGDRVVLDFVSGRPVPVT